LDILGHLTKKIMPSWMISRHMLAFFLDHKLFPLRKELLWLVRLVPGLGYTFQPPNHG
jgi:hypothetical protein